jgi:hypothetical protein
MSGPRPFARIASANAAPDHLVISEVVTGATSASDELIELYNPTVAALPLEGLELVYVSASGLTVSRRAAWDVGAPDVPPGGHLLVAHELGVYASIADATYASGMAATGGSVALRIVGAASAIDAVGWGSAASTWLEGSVAPAPPAGSSLERLPGGPLGSTQDTDDNGVDFVVRSVPGPENSASPPVPDPSSSGSPQPSPTVAPSPSVAATPSPSAFASPSPALSPSPQPTVSPSPGAQVVPIATARALPDGSEVTVEGVALTDSGFADGGGYLADESGGLAVLVSDGSFSRGDRLRVSGSIDDRYAQRTLRATANDLVPLGTAADPAPIGVTTGTVGESVEGRLVRIAGTVLGAPTVLSAGLAFEVDDGSGPVRLLVGTAAGIDVAAWGAGFALDVIGVVGQRDSSGTGTSGYRVQPRDAADVLSAGPGPSPTPTPGPSAPPDASPEPSQPADVISVAAARQLPKGASAVVRGVVTLAPGLVDPTTAALQDASGAIVLRIGEEAGRIVRGTLVEVRGTRSTLSGMETLRVTTPPRSLGTVAEPAARTLRTGDAGELHEAALVVVRGGLVGTPRRSSAGTTSFEIDDGSGPLRVSIGSSAGIEAAQLAAGTWIEVRGILGQETTGTLPLRGYRVWPRDVPDLRVVAPATEGAPTGEDATGGGSGSGPTAGAPLATLDAVGGEAAVGVPIGATLVAGPWEELGIGGLLWDGASLVGLHPDAGPLVAGLLRGAAPPVAVQASGLRVVEVHDSTGIPVAGVPDEPGSIVPSGLPPSPPLAATDPDGAEPRWVTLVGRLDARPDVPALLVAGESVVLEHRCQREPTTPRGTVSVTGILVGEPQRLVVPCGGIVPAPLLLRDTAARHSSQAPAAIATLADGAPEPPRSLPAVLLLLAAATLAAGAVVARWASRDGTPGPDSGEAAAGEDAEAAAPPALTLVPLPRERAP